MKRFQQVPIACLMRANWLSSEIRVRVNSKKVDQYAAD